jgi:hypothetical protein
MRGPGPGYAAWLERVNVAGGRPRLSIAAGDRLAVDDIDLRVLWPVRGEVATEPPDSGTGINNVSVTLLGTVGERRFLLAGDVEEEVDPSLLAAGLPRLDFLKVAHHGSRTATTEAFVAAVRPRVAVASAGTGNRYGHPARSTLERLSSAGARVYRTDQDGSVTATFEPSSMSVRTAPRRGAAAVPAERSIAARGVFLCDVPLQPFVTVSAATPAAGPASALGYHPADDVPRPSLGRCPALPPPDPRRWPSA